MERAPLPRCPQPGLAPAGRVSPAVPTAARGLRTSLPLFWAAHVPRLLPLLGAQQHRGLSPTISAVPMLRLSQLVRSAGAARSPNRSENQSLIYFHDGDARARRCCVCSAVTPIDRRPPASPGLVGQERRGRGQALCTKEPLGTSALQKAPRSPAASASWWFGTKSSHQSPTYPQAVVAVPRAGMRWAHGVDVAVAPWLLLAVPSSAYGNGHGTEMGSVCPGSGQTLLPPDHSTNHTGCPAGRSAGSLTHRVWSSS